MRRPLNAGLLLTTLALGLLSSPAWAEDEVPPFPTDAIEVMGAGLVPQLTAEEWRAMYTACPQEDEAAQVACLTSNETVRGVVSKVTERLLKDFETSLGADLVRTHGAALLHLDPAALTGATTACAEAADRGACLGAQITPLVAALQAAEPAGEAAPESAGEAAPESAGEAAPESAGEAAPESAGEAAPESAGEAAPESAGEAAPESAGEAAPETAPGAEPAAPGSEAGNSDNPAEGIFPPEVVAALPKVFVRFYRPLDYTALKTACPDLDKLAACLETEAAQNVAGEQFGRAVISTLVGYMDAELPRRLAEEDLDVIGNACEKAGEAWGNCVFEKGGDDDGCEAHEETLATCVVGNDAVSELYLSIQQERKALFGPAVYVDFRGLLSVLDMETLKALKAACPQADDEALLACLDANPAVAALVDVFQQVVTELVGEARKELEAAGKPITDEQAEAMQQRFLNLFFRFPVRVLDNVASACSKAHPELDTVDDPAKVDAILECMETEGETDPIANPAFISRERLKGWLATGKAKVIGKLREKELAAQAGAFGRVLIVLGALALLGVLVILIRPFVLVGKYPDRKQMIWRASSLAALTFLLTVASLGVTLLLMRTVQGVVAVDSTSPRMRIAYAVFDVLEEDREVELLSDLSKERLDFIKTPLQAVVRGAGDLDAQTSFVAYVGEHWATLLQEPELASMAKNAVMLKDHVGDFKAVMKFFRKADWILGYVPVLMAILAVLLYLLPMRETLMDLINAPVRAARGDDPNAFASAMHTIKGELKLIVPFLVLMVLILPIVGVFIALGIKPLVEIQLGYAFQTVWYILGADASAWVLDLSLGGTTLVLILEVAVFVMVMGQLLGTLRRILRARFHWGQPLARHGRFFRLGLPATFAVLLFPVGFAYLVHYVAFELVEPTMDFSKLTTMDMLGLPLGACLLFPLLFWILRGPKMMGFVKKWPVTKDAQTTPG